VVAVAVDSSRFDLDLDLDLGRDPGQSRPGRS
jgi:hypothetical protein